VSNKSERSKYSEHSQNLKRGQIEAIKTHIQNWWDNNEEIELVPTFSEVRSFVHD
jgi:hypothetical protein